MESFGSAPEDNKRPAYAFGRFRLEPDGTLLRGGTPVELHGNELAALRLLLGRQGKMVTQAELREAMGADAPATAEGIAETIASLGLRLEPGDLIQTVYKRGFRFTAETHTPTADLSADLPHIAILPLAVEYGVPDYLGSVVAKGAVDRLNRRRPAVCTFAARDSVETLARRGLSPVEIGRAMQASLVLTGTLRALLAHDRMRLEMIRVEDGATLWSEDVLVERGRIAGLEAELARMVAQRIEGGAVAIAAELDPEDGQEPGPASREAYELYQRAMFEWQSLVRHRMQDAVQQLIRAGELDPTLTAARVDLAHLAITEAFHGYLSPASSVGLVRRAALPGFIEARGGEAILPAVGWVSFHNDRDMRSALRAFEQSAHLPHDSWVTRARMMLALSRHRFDGALAILHDAIAVDPWAAWLHGRLAWTLHLAGDADASVRQIKAALEQFPGHEGVELYAGIILAFNGEKEQAVDLAGSLAMRRPYFDPATAVHAYALACAGQTAEARSILERLEWMGRERYVMNSLSAAVYVALGDHDRAMAELNAANDARCPWFFQALADPRLAPLRNRPDFIALERILVDMERSGGNE